MATIFGVAGILIEGGRVLVITEAERNLGYGKAVGMTSVPMGARKPTETPAEAVEREFEEETGLVVRMVCFLGSVTVGCAEVDGFTLERRRPSRCMRAGAGVRDPRWETVESILASAPETIRPPTQAFIVAALLKE